MVSLCKCGCRSKCMTLRRVNLRMLLILLSNFTTALVVYLCFYFYHYYTDVYDRFYSKFKFSYISQSDESPGKREWGLTKAIAQVEPPSKIASGIYDHYSPSGPVDLTVTDSAPLPPPHFPTQVPLYPPAPANPSLRTPQLPSNTPNYFHFSKRTDSQPIRSLRQDNILLCKLGYASPSNSSSVISKKFISSALKSSNSSVLTSSAKGVNQTLTRVDTRDTANSLVHSGDAYIPYVIGITPTYYRLTQKLELTSLCQTLMNVPRFLWIVIEDSKESSQQVKDILNRCQVESILLHAETAEATKKARQRGIDQRNMALQWIRDRCETCRGRGTCEGVVYFMDDDNTYDIRLFEQIRKTEGVSVFPVGLVAGLKFEGPICKDGRVERWQVQYSPKRHIPVDMAAFAVNLNVLMEHSDAKMGFKPNSTKRSTPGYIEPDFLKALGAQRDTVECRGASDEILVWHVKASFRKLVYEGKHPSDPKFKV